MPKREVNRVLLSSEEIDEKVSELARKIENDYAGKEIVVIPILKGSMIFVSDLMRKIGNRVSVIVDVFSVSSYEGTEYGGKARINLDLITNLKGKDVLIVDDIVDTGNTMNYIIHLLKYQRPKTLKVCALLTKPSRRAEGVAVCIDYLGFSIDNHFVVGYGLDYNQQYRNLPYIGILSQGLE